MQSRIYDPSRLQADKTEGLNDRPGTNFMDARPKELELMNQIKYLNQENLYSQTIIDRLSKTVKEIAPSRDIDRLFDVQANEMMAGHLGQVWLHRLEFLEPLLNHYDFIKEKLDHFNQENLKELETLEKTLEHSIEQNDYLKKKLDEKDKKILELIKEKSSPFENGEKNDFEKKEFLYQCKFEKKIQIYFIQDHNLNNLYVDLKKISEKEKTNLEILLKDEKIRNNKLEAENKRLSEKLELTFQELRRLEDSFSKSENIIADFKLKKEIYKQRTEEISGRHADLQAENEELKMSLNSNNKEYQLSKTQCLIYKEELNEFSKSTTEEINKLNKIITQYKTKDQDSRAKTTLLNKELIALREDFKFKNEEAETLKYKLEALISEYSQLEEKFKLLSKHHEKLQKSETSNKVLISNLTSEKDKFLLEKEKLVKDLEAINSDRKREADEQLKDYEDKIIQLNKTIRGLVEEKEEAMMKLQSDLYAHNFVIERLEKENNGLKIQMKEANQNKENLVKKINEQSGEIKDISNKLYDMESDLNIRTLRETYEKNHSVSSEKELATENEELREKIRKLREMYNQQNDAHKRQVNELIAEKERLYLAFEGIKERMNEKIQELNN